MTNFKAIISPKGFTLDVDAGLCIYEQLPCTYVRTQEGQGLVWPGSCSVHAAGLGFGELALTLSRKLSVLLMGDPQCGFLTPVGISIC